MMQAIIYQDIVIQFILAKANMYTFIDPVAEATGN
jgi:hypothetical protein